MPFRQLHSAIAHLNPSTVRIIIFTFYLPVHVLLSVLPLSAGLAATTVEELDANNPQPVFHIISELASIMYGQL